MKWTAARVLQAKRRIMAHPAIVGRVGQLLRGEHYDDFILVLCRQLPGSPDVAVVHSSAQDLLGVLLTEELLDAVIWRLLGNLPKLLRQEHVLPWSGQYQDEWVPVQVLRVVDGVSANGRPGVHLRLQSLAGSCCPTQLHAFWSKRQCFSYARRLGFASAYKHRAMRSPLELMSLRFFVGVKAALSQQRPQFDEIDVDAAFLAWNKRILRLRTRPPGVFRCPEGFDSSVLCCRCYAGLDRCPVAVHELTYVQGFCVDCRNPEAWHDPAQQQDGVCLRCRASRIFRSRQKDNSHV